MRDPRSGAAVGGGRARRRTVAEAVRRFFQHDGLTYAGNMAFIALLALFPFLILVVSVSGFMGQTDAGAYAVTVFLEALPPQVRDALQGPVDNVIADANASLVTAGAVIALWTVSSLMETARVCVIRAYDGWDHARPIWRRRLESIGVAAVAAVLVVAAMSLVILAPPVIMALDYVLPQADALRDRIVLARSVLSPLLIFLALLMLYRVFAPRLPGLKVVAVPGALLATLFWFVLGAIFSIYLTYLGRYNATYGSLAGLIITQIFLFLACIGFVLGAEVNAALARARPRMPTP